MVLGAVLALATVLAAPDRIDVWDQNLRIADLAAKLSAGGSRFTSDPKVSGRRAHIFVRGREPLEIARMTASTMGIMLRRVGTSWRFEVDPGYEKMVRGHGQDVRGHGDRALGRLIEHLQKNPPRQAKRRRETDPKWTASPEGSLRHDLPPLDLALQMSLRSGREDVLWTLARLSPNQKKSLISGHAVVGAVPGRPGCVTLPGTPDDYIRFKGANQAYLVLEYKLDSQELRETAIKMPPQSNVPGASSDRFSLLPGNRGVFSFGEDWSRLGDWSAQWAPSRQTDLAQLLRHKQLPATPSHGQASESVAIEILKPTVVQASPSRPIGRGWDREQIGMLVRQEADWVLMKPTYFWDIETAWALPEILNRLGSAPVNDAKRTLDWLCRYHSAIPVAQQQNLFSSSQMRMHRDGLQPIPRFAKFWMALGEREKSTLLSGGLDRGKLDSDKRRLFTDAVCEMISQNRGKGDLAGFLESGKKSSVSVVARPMWSLRTDSGSAGYPSKERMLEGRRYGQKGDPFRGQYFEIRFESGSGYVEAQASAYVPTTF